MTSNPWGWWWDTQIKTNEIGKTVKQHLESVFWTAHTTLLQIMAFWGVMPYSITGGYQCVKRNMLPSSSKWVGYKYGMIRTQLAKKVCRTWSGSLSRPMGNSTQEMCAFFWRPQCLSCDRHWRKENDIPFQGSENQPICEEESITGALPQEDLMVLSLAKTFFSLSLTELMRGFHDLLKEK
jgi:hypothetical protein